MSDVLDPVSSPPVVVDRFRPEDAPGVVSLFAAVYGASYPVAAIRDPARLVAENEAGRIVSVVARAPSGQVVGHGAFFRSSPPFPGLFEMGLGVVHPAWRRSAAGSRMARFLDVEVGPTSGAEALFAENVCNVTATQKMCLADGYLPVALEVALLPEGSYAREGEPGSVTCLVSFLSFRDRRRTLFVPAPYGNEVSLLLEGLGLERDLAPAHAAPAAGPTAISVETFDAAGVRRASLSRAGDDLTRVLEALDAPGEGAPLRVRQVAISLGDSACGVAVEALRGRGYFLGGLLPRWFDDDALLMQKVEGDPGFSRARLHGERAAAVLDLVRRDHGATAGQG